MTQATLASTLRGYMPFSFDGNDAIEEALYSYFKETYEEATGDSIDYIEDADTAKVDAACEFVRACTKALDNVNVKKFIGQAIQ